MLFAIPSQRKLCLLRPAHDWAMDTLRLIPIDGTYDQCKPLARLLGVNNYSSRFDLKAAIDTFPSLLLGKISSVYSAPLLQLLGWALGL